MTTTAGEIVTVRASAMGKVSPSYSGITHTAGRRQPYATWLGGRIVGYASDEADARDRLRRARLGSRTLGARR